MTHPELQPEAAPIGDGAPAHGPRSVVPGLGGLPLEPVTVPVEESLER
jgi:hypothetical protein